MARMKDTGRTDEAIQVLRIFIEEYPNSREAQEAKKELAALQKDMKDDFSAELDQARQQQRDGNLVEAWTRMEALLDKARAPRHATTIRTAMLEVDNSLRNVLAPLQKDAWRAFARFEADSFCRKARSLTGKVQGLPWGETVLRLEDEGRMVEKFFGSLCNTIDKRAAFKLGIPGVAGKSGLELGKGDRLRCIPPGKGKTQTVAWDQLPEDALWRLLPPAKLKEDERLGAALYFAGRKHFGYACSYLPSEKNKKAWLTYYEIKAARNDRIVVEFFDFAAENAVKNSRWVPAADNDGTWDTTGNKLSCNGERARAALKGRFYSLGNFGLRTNISLGPEGGELRLVLDGGSSGSLTVHLRTDRCGLSLKQGDGPGGKEEGPKPDFHKDILLSIRNGNAYLENGKARLCSLAVPDASKMICSLRLELDAQSGSLEYVVIEEGQ